LITDHYSGGKKFPANPTEGIQWFLKAANQNHEGAQVQLGHWYEGGNHVEKNLVDAYKWFSLAARTNPYDAGHRDRLILKMSSQEIAEGQRRADNFKFGPPPPPSPQIAPTILTNILLKAISSGKARRTALINDTVFSSGDDADIKAAGKTIHIKCYEILENSAIIGVAGTTERHEIHLR
jgi:TPR repeat protein